AVPSSEKEFPLVIINTNYNRSHQDNKKFPLKRHYTDKSQARKAGFIWTEQDRKKAISAIIPKDMASFQKQVKQVLQSGVRNARSKYTKYATSGHEPQRVRINCKDGRNLAFIDSTLDQRLRDQLLDKFMALFPDGLKHTDTEEEGIGNTFPSIHFVWYNRYATRGDGAPKDVHPDELYNGQGSRLNTAQFLPRLSKEAHENMQKYHELEEAFQEIWQYQRSVVEKYLPEEYEALRISVDLLPSNDMSPTYPFGGVVLNFNVSTLVHRDWKDLNVCLVMPISACQGGALVLHELGIVVECQSGDMKQTRCFYISPQLSAVLDPHYHHTITTAFPVSPFYSVMSLVPPIAKAYVLATARCTERQNPGFARKIESAGEASSLLQDASEQESLRRDIQACLLVELQRLQQKILIAHQDVLNAELYCGEVRYWVRKSGFILPSSDFQAARDNLIVQVKGSLHLSSTRAIFNLCLHDHLVSEDQHGTPPQHLTQNGLAGGLPVDLYISSQKDQNLVDFYPSLSAFPENQSLAGKKSKATLVNLKTSRGSKAKALASSTVANGRPVRSTAGKGGAIHQLTMAANIVGAGLERSLQKTETKKHSRDELDNAPHNMAENHMAPLPKAKRRKAGQVDAPVPCAIDPPLKPAAPLPRSHLPDWCWNLKIVWSVLSKDLNILPVHLLFSQEVYTHHKVFLKVFQGVNLRSSMDALAKRQGPQIALQRTKNPTYQTAQIHDNIMVNSNKTNDEQDMDVDNAFEKNTSYKDSNENISSEDNSSDDGTDDCYDKDGNEEDDEDEEEDEDNNIDDNNLRPTTESITLPRMAADDFQDNTYGGQHDHYDDEFQQEDEQEDTDVDHVDDKFQQEDADVNYVDQQEDADVDHVDDEFQQEDEQEDADVNYVDQQEDADVDHVDQQQSLEAHEIDEQSPSEDERQADAVLHAPRSCTPYDKNKDISFEGNHQPTFNIEGEEPHGLEDQDSHKVPLIQDVLTAHHKKNRSNRPPKRSHLVAAANHHRQVQGIYNNHSERGKRIERQDPQVACHTEEPETIQSAGDPVTFQGTYISDAISGSSVSDVSHALQITEVPETTEDPQVPVTVATRAPRNSLKSKGNHDPTILSFYPSVWQVVIKRAKIKYQKHVALIHSFPSKAIDADFKVAKAILSEEIAQGKNEGLLFESGFSFSDDMASVVFEEGSTFRGRLKTMGRTSVLRFYSKDLDPLVENQGQLESDIVANANRLLSIRDSEYLKGGKDANGKTNNFSHPCIRALCIEFFYTGNDCLAHHFPDNFKDSVPELCMVLVMTCITNCIHEFQRFCSGERAKIQFSGTAYQPTVNALLRHMEDIKANPYHAQKLLSNRQRWAQDGIALVIA
ncbi:uncharacterized protein LACBIDRAFT_326329, partial [Laccaria bicolor S238N-H82]